MIDVRERGTRDAGGVLERCFLEREWKGNKEGPRNGACQVMTLVPSKLCFSLLKLRYACAHGQGV